MAQDRSFLFLRVLLSVHSTVRLGKKVVRAGAVVGREGNPDTQGHDVVTANLAANGGCQCGQGEHFIGDTVLPQAGNRHDEFIAAEAREDIGPASDVFESLGKGLQKPIADVVAKTVVHFLEIVQIAHHDREGRLLLFATLEFLLQTLE